MVQKCCSNDSITAAITANRRRKRRENCRIFTCFSPCSIISSWLSLKKSRNGMDVDTVEFRDEDSDDEAAPGCLHEESSSNSPREVSEEHRKEASFSLAVGFALIYLMATSKMELNKMVELSKQTETLLQKRQLKKEVAGTDIETAHTSSKVQEVSEIAITDHGSLQEVSNHAIIEHVSLQDGPSSSWEQEYSESDITSSCCNSKIKEGKLVEMDQLEAELEAELENLQLQLDTEIILNYPDKNYTEIVVDDSAPEESQSTTFREVFEQPEMGNHEYYHGVPPRELERRLHELQEVRQEERIRKLESALEFAIHKLNENQRELSRWKDASRVVFRRIPLGSRSMRWP